MRQQAQRFIKEVVDEGLFGDDEDDPLLAEPLLADPPTHKRKAKSEPYREPIQLEFNFDVAVEEAEGPLLKLFRPQTRADCADIPRPCPFIACRYNLYLDVRDDGGIRFNFPDREPDEMTASCVLDLASDGPRTLDLIGGLMGVSKERARQLEASALKKVKQQFDPDEND